MSSNKASNDNSRVGSTGYKLITLGTSFLGAMATRKLLALTWKTVSGNEPPANPEHPSVTWPEAVSWAVVSGAFIGLARLAAQKKVAASWHRATGSLPPGLEETAA